MIVARTSSDAPDIDGLVYIDISADGPESHICQVGDITQVTITHTDEYDMWARFARQWIMNNEKWKIWWSHETFICYIYILYHF